MRIIFAGTPDFAAASLAALLTTDHQIVAVYTQPDRQGKRKNQLAPRPVKDLALAHDIPVFQPHSLKDEAEQAQLKALNADLMVVVAYGMLLPKAVLDTPRLGCINVHGSILPRWRGAAPVERAMLAGDRETGVTIMQMDEGLDTGAMLHKVFTPIDDSDTAASLFERLAPVGAQALLETLPGLEQGTITPEVQDDAQATYASKLDKREGRIDWTQSARQIDLKVRALSPRVAVTFQLDGEPVKLLACEPLDQQGGAGEILPSDKKSIVVGCGEGALKINQLQLPGKKAMAAADVLNARRERFSAGQTLA
ncbi:methionyl-tRNA formyltransferase [Marinobacterium arenosum]|uniref:methionyl-tRNA formyltransferase n=1 Tax=Marinobacterium arenosum TaxID=2862496 RepID=UPI001C9620D0|nr:methionyl-tRNA formyltransferase [Marinobacterium arenosum]MBY4677729.1 methionyl-tRNA formyltransferase [Marinobacterium arenosum]